MGILEIISAICLILSCVFIIIMVLMQDSKKGMSQTLTGGSSDNFYQRNSGRSKEARLAKATRTAAILFFVVTLIVNVFAIYFKGEDENEDIEPDLSFEDWLAEQGDDFDFGLDGLDFDTD
ncbi:MAG: preprotein translocase subunit SecG [Oscillospiraceae bacterium]|nr:preprotein translocase subunit SecG [Oscillospiraceae bacterium]